LGQHFVGFPGSGEAPADLLQWTVRLLSFMALTKWMLDLVNAIL
jgi:hypothetical protein